MSYNFKSIADVEVVTEPTDTANVLIEENGVIKKAPKTAVGGAGGNNTIVFSIKNTSGEYDIVAPEGLYEKLTDMFNKNICIDIVPYIYSHDQFQRCTMNKLFRSEDIFEAWFNNSTYHLKVYPNDTMDFYYDD